MNRDYYAGMTQGRVDEHRRIVGLIQSVASQANKNKNANSQKLAVVCSFLVALINGESYCPAHNEGKFDAGCTCEKGIAERMKKV